MISGLSITRCDLDVLYHQYNRRDQVHPDPLVFLYAYPDIRDREIAGLLASSLAYGRVAQIYKSLCCVLEKMGPSPLSFLNHSTRQSLTAAYGGFSHRFATGGNLVNLMLAIKDVLDRYGSIHGCFRFGHDDRFRDGAARSDAICRRIHRWGFTGAGAFDSSAGAGQCL